MWQAKAVVPVVRGIQNTFASQKNGCHRSLALQHHSPGLKLFLTMLDTNFEQIFYSD